MSAPILFLHGMATNARRTWGETGWLDLVGDAGREVLAFDLLGHGSAPQPTDPAEYDAFEQYVLDRLPDEPVDAVGFSLGSRTLLVLAAAHPERFGKGEIQGVIAPETAAHAAGTSALLPMLTLGIPGSPTAAVLLGGLLIWGLQPGPMLFVEQKDFVWGLIASMYLGNIVGLIVVLTTVPWWAAILRIPFSVIAPVIIVICAIGAYTVHSSMFDVVLMLVFGVLGYLFKKLKYPLAPLVLALVLGDMAEASFRQAMLLSQGSLAIFWSNPLVGSIVALAMVMLLWPLWGLAKRSVARREGGAFGEAK